MYVTYVIILASLFKRRQNMKKFLSEIYKFLALGVFLAIAGVCALLMLVGPLLNKLIGPTDPNV